MMQFFTSRSLSVSALTKDVDLTITNILEGRVQFSPEEPGVEATPSTSVANSSQQKVTNSSNI